MSRVAFYIPNHTLFVVLTYLKYRYCCEVRLNQFREPREGEKKIIRIGADIIVERSSQKVPLFLQF